MVNSIRDNLDEAHTISVIKLELTAQKDFTFVLVEGQSDIQLFAPLLNDKVDLIESYGGKNAIENIILKHFKGERRVIGIRDRDYQQTPKSSRIFFCDYCCAEMMIVADTDCFYRLYINYHKRKKLISEELRIYCLRHLELLSKIRKLNELYAWNIRLFQLDTRSLFDDDITTMNANIIHAINNIDENNQLDTSRRDQIDEESCKNLSDYLMITNGHDFLHIFCELCNGCSLKAVEQSLRCTFSITEFQRTNLYKDLVSYEQKHNLHIVAA